MDFTASHLTTIIVALITGILSPLTLQIFYYLVKRKNIKKKESLNSKEHIKTDESILKKLEWIKEKYHCDRVWLAEFHNGIKTYSGKSFQKFSVTYECVSQGIAAEAVNTQNIPTTIFTPFFRKLVEDHYYYAKNTKEKNDNISAIMESFWENRGIKSFLALSIKDLNNNFVGFICLDGVINGIEIEDLDIQKLITSAYNLAGYLEQ
jgi:hypothetical protein